MSIGMRVQTPEGRGTVVGFRGLSTVIVSLDDGRYVECPIGDVR